MSKNKFYVSIAQDGILSGRFTGYTQNRVPIDIKRTLEFIESLSFKPTSKVTSRKRIAALTASFINFHAMELDPGKFVSNIKELADEKYKEIEIESKKKGVLVSNMSIQIGGNSGISSFCISYDEFNVNENNSKIIHEYFNNEPVEFNFNDRGEYILLEYAGTEVEVSILEKSPMDLNRLLKLFSTFYKFEYMIFRLNQLQKMEYISLREAP